MSALGQMVLKKLGKKRQKSAPHTTLQRWPSNQQIHYGNGVKNAAQDVPDLPFRGRSKTFTDGVTKPRLRSLTHPEGTEQSCLEDIQLTFTSPRHFLRRKALVESELQDDVSSSKLLKIHRVGSDSVEDTSLTLCMDVEGYKLTDSVQPIQSHSLLDMIEFLFNKNDVDLKHDLEQYSIKASCSGEAVAVKLDDPSTEYTSCSIEIKVPQVPLTKSNRETSNGEIKEKAFSSVSECLEYFDSHGLSELPQVSHSEEEPYHLPRVHPLEPIPESWGQLPINPDLVSALTDKEVEQQRAIWELICTEFTHLQTLETIINVFMRCLELIRRADLLKEDNYHNIFGYMEDLYHAHEQLWTYTFEPCLSKTMETNCPLDLDVIITRFPRPFGRHFEVYEQHCAMDRFNVNSLKKATRNTDFNAYLKWCQARPECNRLELKQLLVTPMQRITKYSLLVNAIAKKTQVNSQKESLGELMDEINSFVHVVNNAIRIQEETERVKDAMNRITTYNVVDVPHELKDMAQSHMCLDLMAPMPGVELDKPRVLMVEGSLNYKDSKTKPSAAYVFLFTDMLLITKLNRKASNKYTVIRPPIKITSLKLDYLDSDSISCLVLNEYNTVSSWFILKANSASVAKEWLEQISAAQQFYQDAVEKKIQTGKMIESLRSERILNGIENLDSLNASLSQSLWSIHSLTSNGKLGSHYASNESLAIKRTSSSSTVPGHAPLTKANSVGTNFDTTQPRRIRSKFKSMSGSVDFANMRLERTTSVGIISERPRSFCDGVGISPKLLGNSTMDETRASGKQQGSEHVSPTIGRSWLNPLSDDSGTEGSDTHLDESASKAVPEVRSSMYQAPFVRARNTRRRKNSRRNLSDSTYCSGSLGDISDLANKSERINHLSLSSSSPDSRLLSAISRTPSPRADYRPVVPPSIASTEDHAKYRQERKDTETTNVRPKRHSVGARPDPIKFFPNSTLYSLSEYPTSARSDSFHLKSRSESCPSIYKPDSSNDMYKDLSYIGSQKPNVATVEEEEEATDSSSLERQLAIRINEVDIPKSSKSKVVFSDLTQVHSFDNSQGSDSELESYPSSPNTLPLIPGWKPPKSNAVLPKATSDTKPNDLLCTGTIFPDEELSSVETTSLTSSSSFLQHEDRESDTIAESLSPSTGPLFQNESDKTQTSSSDSHFNCQLSDIPVSCNSNNSNTESTALVKQAKTQSPVVSGKRAHLPLTQSQQSIKMTIKKKHTGISNSTKKSVKELSDMFEKSTGPVSKQPSLNSVPSIEVTESALSDTPASSTSLSVKAKKPEPSTSSSTTTRGTKRKQSMSKKPLPKTTPNSKRVNSHVLTEPKFGGRNSHATGIHSATGRNPPRVTQKYGNSHDALHGKKPSRMPQSRGSPSSKPRSIGVKKGMPATSKLITEKLHCGSSNKESGSSQQTEIDQGILQSNCNSNNNAGDFSLTMLETKVSSSAVTSNSTPEDVEDASSSPCEMQSSTIFRPRRAFSDCYFDKSTEYRSLHKKLKHHHSFGDSSPRTLSRLIRHSQVAHHSFKHPNEWNKFGAAYFT